MILFCAVISNAVEPRYAIATVCKLTPATHSSASAPAMGEACNVYVTES